MSMREQQENSRIYLSMDVFTHASTYVGAFGSSRMAHVESNLGSRGKDSALKARITTPRHYNASDSALPNNYAPSSLRLDSALPMEILHLAETLLAEAGMLSVAQALAGQTPTGGASYGVPSC